MQFPRSVIVVSCLLLSLPGLAMAADPPAAGHLHSLLTAGDATEELAAAAPRSQGKIATTAAARPLDKKVPPTATVAVDCTNGGSINDALTTPAVTLTIQIHGICTESLLITRNRVTLVGTSPATDGIRGDPNPAVSGQVVAVVGGAAVVQSLSISASGRAFGLSAWSGGFLTVSNCDVFGNSKDGIVAIGGFITVANTTIHNNGRADLSAWAGSDLFCDQCTLSGSRIGTLSISGARISLTNSNIQASVIAFGAAEHGFISFDTGSFASSIDVEDQSQLSISTGTQTADPSGFYASMTSSVLADNHTVLLGAAGLYNFSNLSLQNGSTITGNLACYSAANAWCENSSAVSGTTTGCSSCVKP